MTIVLDEHEWAENMIKTRSLGQKPFETLYRVARYYIDKQYSKKDVRRLLDSFLLQCDPTASIPKWSDALDRALDKAVRCPAIKIDSINITEPEMKKINSLDGKLLKRLAFTLICLAKYWDIANSTQGHWVNNQDSEIMRLANIKTSIKRQSLLYYKLHEAGLIQFSKKVDNTNVRVVCVESGEPAVAITDFRNLGYQYLKYCGEPCFDCCNCGLTLKLKESNGRKPKYCRECAVAVQAQQHINVVMRQRQAQRAAVCS